MQFLLPDKTYKFRMDYNATQHWSDEIAIIPHTENPIELDLTLLALDLTNDPHPDRFDGTPPKPEPVLLASLFDIPGILARSIVADTGTDSQVFYYINDHLGTPQKVIDETGSVVWEAGYQPFASVNIGVERITNNFRFPGQYFDTESGFHYNYHRYYDPKTGRYLTPDPIGLAGGMNRFSYTGLNPINKIDPFGLFDRRYQNRPVMDPGSNYRPLGAINLPVIDPSQSRISQFNSAMDSVNQFMYHPKTGIDMLEWYNSRKVKKNEFGCPMEKGLDQKSHLQEDPYQEDDIWPGVIE